MVAKHKDIKTMKYFEKWSEGKSPLLKMACFAIATNQKDIFDFLQTVKDGKQLGGYAHLPSATEWLKLYRNHRRIHEGITNAVRQISDDAAKAVDFYEQFLSGLRNLRHITNSELQEMLEELSDAERNEIANSHEEIQEIITNDLNIGNEVPGLEFDAAEKEKFSVLFSVPEMIFFTRVWAPCLFLYGNYPTRLLRKARQGDNDALENLLRLDQTVIADKKIIELYHQGKVAKKKATYNLFTKALSKKPKVKLTRRKIENELAGLISAVSSSLGQRLTTPDIAELFDAISKDTGKDNDTDFFKDQNQPGALTKAVNRARSKWQTIPQPDKK